MALRALRSAEHFQNTVSEPGISLADAKAHLSEVVTGVEQRRQAVTILRRGHPVARIVPFEMAAPALYGSMKGTVVEVGDIIGPTGEEWTLSDD